MVRWREEPVWEWRISYSESGNETINILSDHCLARQVGLKYKLCSVASRRLWDLGVFNVMKRSSNTFATEYNPTRILAVQNSRLDERNVRHRRWSVSGALADENSKEADTNDLKRRNCRDSVFQRRVLGVSSNMLSLGTARVERKRLVNERVRILLN